MRFFINFSLDTKLTNGLPTNASFRDVEKKLNGKNIIGFFKMNNQSYESVKNPLNKSLDDGDYVIFLEGYSFPGSGNKDTFIKQTVNSNLQNKNKEITDPSRYGFMQKSLFGKVTYPLPNPLKINFSEVATQVVNDTTEEPAKKAKEEADRKAKEEAATKAKEEADRKAKEEAATKAKEEAARKATEQKQNDTPEKKYLERQEGTLACGKYSINHLLQEEKIVDSKTGLKLISKSKTTNINQENVLDTDAQLNLAHYCKILQDFESNQLKSQNNDKMCNENNEHMRFNGIDILLTLLGYKTFNFHNMDIRQNIKIQLQRRKCLGIILNLGKYHYTCITKFYSKPNVYTYIDSIGPDVKQNKDIEEFMKSIKTLKIEAAICVYDYKDAYASVAANILRQNLKPPDEIEITDDDAETLKTLADNNFETLLTKINEDSGVYIVSSFGNDAERGNRVLTALKSWEVSVNKMYGDDPVPKFLREYNVTNVDDLIYGVNFINETEAIKNRGSVDSSKSDFQPPPPPPPPPPPSYERSQHTLPVSSDSTGDLTEDEKTYLKKVYTNPLYLAYDLRNFMGITDIIIKQPMTMTGKNFTLKNGIMHNSYLKNEFGDNNPPIYQKLYTKSVNFEKNKYESFYKKIEESTGNPDDKWNMVFDWINEHKQNTSSITKEIKDDEVEEEIGQLLNKTVSSAQYIPTIFTLLPKILRGDELQTAKGQYNGKTLNKNIQAKIRKTFKEAINSLNLMKGGKKTHKLKIKKRKTYKIKSLRHKTRNAINRL
jgi:hypothetical protein